MKPSFMFNLKANSWCKVEIENKKTRWVETSVQWIEVYEQKKKKQVQVESDLFTHDKKDYK